MYYLATNKHLIKLIVAVSAIVAILTAISVNCWSDKPHQYDGASDVVWLGVQSLGCLTNVTLLHSLGLSHFFILYKDHVFEWGSGPRFAEHYGPQPGTVDCDVTWQYVGRSALSVKDAIDFTLTYEERHGAYDLFTNNCFTFIRQLCALLLSTNTDSSADLM